MESANTTPDKEKKSSLGFTLNLVGIPAAVFAGFHAMRVSIRRGFYKSFARQGAFEELQKVRDKAHKALTDACDAGIRTDIKQDVIQLHKQYRYDVMKRVEKFGYRDMSDHFSALKNNERIESMIMFATISGIGIGALLAISNQVDKYANEQLQNQSQEQERG